MNIEVALGKLRTAVSERGAGAYVLTVAEDGFPHSVYLPVSWIGNELVAEVGARTAANATARPKASVLFPVRSEDDYSLIVDGTATVESSEREHRIRVAPTRAVFHRAGPPADPASTCTSDCRPVLVALPSVRSTL
jgi:hypothetical protein